MGRLKGSVTGKHTLVPLVCPRCGKTFYRYPFAAQTARYCSLACLHPAKAAVRCQRCGVLFVPGHGSHGAYCSRACCLDQVQKVCPHCGVTFSRKRYLAARTTYCSLACKRQAQAAALVTLTCAHCQKEFVRAPSQAVTRRFCSKACATALGRALATCPICGKQTDRKRSRVTKTKGNCCSNRCGALLRLRLHYEPAWITRKRKTGYRTDIEAMTERVLQDLAIPYDFEHRVGRYSVDFALPTLGIALECDGWRHATEQGRAKDVIRDAFLRSEGWQPVHVLDAAIRADAGEAVRTALEVSTALH